MYKVRYFMSGGTLTSKTFNSLHDAIMFCVYKAGFEAVHEVYKI